MNFTYLVGKPLEGGPLYRVQPEQIRRFGKRCIYGNSTQFTVAELVSGEIVHLKHADQPDPKAFSAFIRKRLKGVWADAGIGRQRRMGCLQIRGAEVIWIDILMLAAIAAPLVHGIWETYRYPSDKSHYLEP